MTICVSTVIRSMERVRSSVFLSVLEGRYKGDGNYELKSGGWQYVL